MANDQIFIGSGISKFEDNIIECSICVSDIPKEWITEYNGKKYLRIKVQRKREPDKFGKTHSVSINTFKPEPKTNIEKWAKKNEPTKQEYQNDIAGDLPF